MSDGMDEIIDDFVVEAEESLDKIDPLFVELEARGHDSDLLNEIFRSMHTIKGAAGFLGFQSIVDVAHKTETLMKKLRDGEMRISTPLISLILRSVDMLKLLLGHIKARDGREEDISGLVADLEAANEGAFAGAPGADPAAGKDKAPSSGAVEHRLPEAKRTEVGEGQTRAPEKAAEAPQEAGAQGKGGGVQTLRVDVDRIDKVMNLTGEIVLVRNRLLNIANYLEQRFTADEHVESLQETVAFLDLVTSDMQLAVMKMRMQPIKKVFGKFPRLVRDISQSLGKEVELSISGEETEVDRSVIERIGDPMVHIIRNAIDHGIEKPEARASLGKPGKGRVDVSAFQQGNQIIIEVTDDGKGIDVDRVKGKAVQKGLLAADDAQKMTDKEACNLIFHAGFTTVDVASEMSGRGVGMDVVKNNIAKLNGYVEVLSAVGVGTTLRISIPLTLAIIQALMVRTEGEQYAIPLGPIEETLKISRQDVDYVTGNRVLSIRDKVLPLMELTDVLGYRRGDETPEHRYVLVMAIGERRFCLAVDELLGQEEVVIKAIEGIDNDMTGILGATITGDGRIVLILDPATATRTMGVVSAG